MNFSGQGEQKVYSHLVTDRVSGISRKMGFCPTLASYLRFFLKFFMTLLTFFSKSCNAHMLHASGVHYSYMVSGPNFEFRKVICNF